MKQVPLHPREQNKRIERLDEKMHIVKAIATAKPKPIKAKRKIDKMKFLNEQVRATNENTENLMLGEFNFDPNKY